ncbi:MAG: transporter permease [Panacagrimonas sp.]|nr:ABC transporter permease [Panacagrimonas sp.]MCC2657409.1 transporter permease [Panacagrimonas sp.]
MLRQVLAVTLMNLRSIPSRLGTSLVIVVGIGGVVGVLVALLAMAEGFKQTLSSTGRADRALVLRAGSNDELASVFSLQNWAILRDLPGIKRDAEGKPLAIGERYILSDVKKRGANTGANVVVRGTTPDVLRVRPEARIVAGRMFEEGKREVVVGRGAQDQYQGLEIGRLVEVRDGAWPIVGVFETGGDVHESELWVDLASLNQALRSSFYATATVHLQDARPATLEAFKNAVRGDPRLNLGVQREPDYYASRSVALEKFITILGYSVAAIMAIGAVFGALNTMYAAVSVRTTEIATLRAIGFNAIPVVVSVLIEAVLLALLGSLLGAGIAYAVFNGYTVSTLNFQTFSQVAFAFRVTPDLLVRGVVWACVIGLIGGLFPAVRAARLPVAQALRAG